MARYDVAEKITGRNEGGYAFNKADSGGETYAGIARNYWPKWEGWEHIDGYKDDYKSLYPKGDAKYTLARWINNSAKVATEPVIDLVSKFYKQNFWDVNKLDQINDQQIANTVYDFGVNSGTPRAAKFLQQALGLEQDGKIGPKTLAAVNSIPPKITHNKYNSLREAAYRSWDKGDQAQFLRSWLSRLKPYQS